MNWNFLRGPSNTDIDSARVLFFVGGISAIFSPVGFEIWAMIRHQVWDAVSFCVAYGGLLSGYIVFGPLGIKTKDMGVASANAIPCATPGSDT